MEEGRHVNFTEFCPSTLSRASTKWHERLGKSDLVKILYVQLNNTKKKTANQDSCATCSKLLNRHEFPFFVLFLS